MPYRHQIPPSSASARRTPSLFLPRAAELQRQGRDIINLGIGQPDFKTPPHIVEAAVKALRDGEHGYTDATGIRRCARRWRKICIAASASTCRRNSS